MKNIKNFNQFINEGKKLPSEPSMVDTSKDAKSAGNLKMTNALRKRIINTAKHILYGRGIDETEKNVDKYIKKICKELGFEFSEFYAMDGKKLNAMLDKKIVNESSGDLPEYALVIRDEISKLKKGPEGGSIDIGKTFGKDVSQTDIKNLMQEYPDAVVYYKNGRTLLKLKD